jgi:hypothetical protein
MSSTGGSTLTDVTDVATSARGRDPSIAVTIVTVLAIFRIAYRNWSLGLTQASVEGSGAIVEDIACTLIECIS